MDNVNHPKHYGGDTIKVLEVSSGTIKGVANIYREASVTYPNLSPNPVATISVDALLVTKDYRSPTKIKELNSFRNCLAERIDDLRETRGFHAKWAAINPTATPKWQQFKPEAAPKSP